MRDFKMTIYGKQINVFTLAFGIILFGLLLGLKLPVFTSPHHWDTATRMIDVMWLKSHNFNPFLGSLGQGRPPLFLEIMAAIWSVFGHSIKVSRLVVILFSFLGAYFTYFLGKHLFDELTGISASLLLIFSPLYFAQSGLENFEIPLTALTVMTIYFALTTNALAYLASAVSLVLTKETGILTIPPVVFYSHRISQSPKKMENTFLYSIPIFFLLGWFLLCKFYFGWFLYPYHTSLFYFNAFSIGARFIANVVQLFFRNYQWVLTGFVIFSFISADNRYPLKFDKKNFAIGFIAAIATFLVLSNIQTVISYLISNIQVIKSSVRSGNLAKSLGKELFTYRFVISGFVLVLLSAKRYLSTARWLNHNLLITLLIILSYLSFFSVYAVSLPRYLLPVYPLFFILGIGFAKQVLKRPSLVVILTFLLLIAFVSGWTGKRSGIDGANLESNLEYLDLVSTHKRATAYIEKYYPKVTVLTTSIMFYELRYPFLGYVDKPIKVEITPTLYDELNFSPFGKSVKTRNVYNYDPDNIDLVYFSPEAGQPYVDELLEMMSRLDLKLLKRFVKNGKRTEIYRVDKSRFSTRFDRSSKE